ncbi:hypothetical protein VKT23_010214 [Stygiomarasmius scandens]|uniref:Uncharacterized protein n=1 Tax=Marasmiellus scandens TaxID=2682957 RepID=A0ABR1JGF9_9AGAR
MKILLWTEITHNELLSAHRSLCEFVKGYEELYYQRNPDRIHFVRQTIHVDTHAGPETVRAGPLACYAQWTMESLLGNLNDECHNDCDRFANIQQRALLRAQGNALSAMFPHLSLIVPDKTSRPSNGAADIGDGYYLLPAVEPTRRAVTEQEASAIRTYWAEKNWPNLDKWPGTVSRWARLLIPNGQIVRSSWFESKAEQKLRTTRMVKIFSNGKYYVGEIQYFFCLKFGETINPLCVVSLFTPPDTELLKQSCDTVYVCHYQGAASLGVFSVKDIDSVVAMVPDYKVTGEGEIITPENRYFMVEKPFLKARSFGGESDYGSIDEFM